MGELLLRLKNKNIKLIQLSDDTIVVNMCCELSDIQLNENSIKELQIENKML